MPKKPLKNEAQPEESPQSLGEFLGYIRGIKKLTLRDVEEATEKEVSNAYLSQLETGKISQPRPNILHSLAAVYGVPYEVLMEKAGYLSAASVASELRGAGSPRRARVSLFDRETLTQDEEERLLEYLAFLRWRRNRAV
jgi:HTH-type transcriptional regulator, competence development regulator